MGINCQKKEYFVPHCQTRPEMLFELILNSFRNQKSVEMSSGCQFVVFG